MQSILDENKAEASAKSDDQTVAADESKSSKEMEEMDEGKKVHSLYIVYKCIINVAIFSFLAK